MLSDNYVSSVKLTVSIARDLSNRQCQKCVSKILKSAFRITENAIEQHPAGATSFLGIIASQFNPPINEMKSGKI